MALSGCCKDKSTDVKQQEKSSPPRRAVSPVKIKPNLQPDQRVNTGQDQRVYIERR